MVFLIIFLYYGPWVSTLGASLHQQAWHEPINPVHVSFSKFWNKYYFTLSYQYKIMWYKFVCWFKLCWHKLVFLSHWWLNWPNLSNLLDFFLTKLAWFIKHYTSFNNLKFHQVLIIWNLILKDFVGLIDPHMLGRFPSMSKRGSPCPSQAGKIPCVPFFMVLQTCTFQEGVNKSFPY